MRPNDENRRFAVFACKSWFLAIAISEVAELRTDESVQVSPVGGSIVIGFINYKGTLCPIIELSHLITESENAASEIEALRERSRLEHTKNLLILNGRQGYVGFPLEAKPRILTLQEDQMVKSEQAVGRVPMPFVKGFARSSHLKGALIAILSLNEYLDSTTFTNLTRELSNAA